MALLVQTDEQPPQPLHSRGSTLATMPFGPPTTSSIALFGQTWTQAPQCMQTLSFTLAATGFAIPDSLASRRNARTTSEILTPCGHASSQRWHPEQSQMNSEDSSSEGLPMIARYSRAVSYTHLTLPTIYS